jgi:peroxiredoxin
MTYRIPTNKLFVFVTTIILLFILSCDKKSQGLTIEASVQNISDGTTFYLKNWRNSSIIDSAKVVNGQFVLNGSLSGPEHLFLYATDSITSEFLYTNLILGNEHVTFNAYKKDFPWDIDVIGSNHQDIAERFNVIEFQKQELRQLLENSFETLPEEERVEQEQTRKLKNLSDSLNQVKLALLKENFNSYACMINFKYYKNQIPNEELKSLVLKLSPELRESIYGKAIQLQLAYPPPQTGDQYYDYTGVNQYGDSVSLSDFDKFLLLHFSHAACFYSQKSIPEQRKIYDRFSDKLEIVKISQDLNSETWKKSILRDSITWINLWDGDGEYSDAVIKYGVVGAPNYVLISPDKTVVEKWFGYEDGIIQDKLRKHLQQSY